MATPFFDLIEELRALGGAPKVTYPTGNNNYPQTERTIKAKRGTHILALGSAEPDTVRFPSNILTEQVELRSDAQVAEVYRKYEVLPGPFTKQGQDYDPEYGFLAEYTEGEVKNGAAIGTAVSDIEPENYIKSNLKTYTIPTAALNAFYLTFPGTDNIELPKVLTAVEVVWNVTTGTGTYSETGTGSAVGTSGSLNLSSQGRGQGSASVLADIAPIFAPSPPPNLPVIDYFFFLPNPVTLAAILTRASAVATAIAGSSVTVNAWPLFRTMTHTIVVSGQKVSASCEAMARVTLAFSTSGTSYGNTSGTGKNLDFGSTVRAITLPECIHGAVPFIGLTSNSKASSASASAYINLGPASAGSSTPTTLSTPAVGSITRAALAATPTPSYPASGLYLYKPDVSPYKWGYSAVRARIFDFSILALPQITTFDFTAVTGTEFATGSAGLGFILSSATVTFGIWFNTGAESQPDFSADGVTLYVAISISSGDSSGQVADAFAVQMNAAESANWTAVIDPSNANIATLTAVVNGSAQDAYDYDTGVSIAIAQQGLP